MDLFTFINTSPFTHSLLLYVFTQANVILTMVVERVSFMLS